MSCYIILTLYYSKLNYVLLYICHIGLFGLVNRSLNEPYRYRMQQVISEENAALVQRILSVGPTFNRRAEERNGRGSKKPL